MEERIIQMALDNLERNTHIVGKWTHIVHHELDGRLIVRFNKEIITLNAEIKGEVRPYNLPEIYKLAKEHEPLIIVAERIYPKMKQELREHQIAYLEANGNAYINHKHAFIWIDGNKAIKLHKGTGNRAFTKTGLRVVYEFLLDENWINKPYREIAEKANTGLGNINNVINGLKTEGFLIKLNKNEYRLQNKKELLQKWIGAYEKHLKPLLLIGKFRFAQNEDFLNWNKLELKKDKTWWGGEPAGDLLTNYLRPGELTLYTLEERMQLIKHYHLLPDPNGNVNVYKAFWYQEDKVSGNVVPPLLTYADLVNTGDKRCLETAKLIYDELLASKF